MTTGDTKYRLKFHISSSVKHWLKEYWLNAKGFRQKRKLTKFLGMLGDYADLSSDVHVFFNKTPQSKDKEIIITSEEGKDGVLRFFSDPSRMCNECLCTIPEFNANYNSNWGLIQNEITTFFEMDIKKKLLIPRFNKKYLKQGNAIVGSRCIEISDTSRYVMATFEIDKCDEYVLYTLIIPNKNKALKMLDDYTSSIVILLGQVDDGNSYSYYQATKQLLENLCASFIIEVYDNKASYFARSTITGACTSRIVVKDNTVWSFMEYDPIRRWSVTVFADQSWICRTEHQEVKKENDNIHQSEINVSDLDVSNVKSLREIRSQVPDIIVNRLWYAFK